MDFNEIWNDFEPENQTPTEPVSLQERMEDASSPTLPFLSPDDLENILDSLFLDEDMIGHINNVTAATYKNNDHDMESGYDLFTSPGYTKQVSSPNDLSSNLQYNLQSNPVYGNLDQFSPSSFANYGSSSFSSDTSHVSFPMETNITSLPPLNSTLSPSETANNPKGLDLNTQVNLMSAHNQSSVINLKIRDFKQTLSLSTDLNDSTVKEPWQPKVAKKILSAYYTPLNLKSAFMANQVAVDELQSMAMNEAVSAFHTLVLRKPIMFRKGLTEVTTCPDMFVKSCKKVRAYKRLLVEDKLTLVSNIFFDALALESVLSYDQQTDTWNCSGITVNRSDVFRMDASLHNAITRIIETFPDRWRKDLTVISLLYLIIIFNPDIPGLKFEEAIRLEQYTYIYLLQRYLEMTCKSPCEASEYHYRLMAKIIDIQNLRQQMQYFFQMHIIDYSVSGCLLRAIAYYVTGSIPKRE